MPTPRTSKTLPKVLKVPRVPTAPFSERRFQVGGQTLRPFATNFPIPSNEEEDFLRRYDAKRATMAISIPEYIVYEFLVYKKHLIEKVDFDFQTPMFGGRTQFGGFVADFSFFARRMIWRVQGEHFHLLLTQDRANDTLSREIFVGQGWKVLDLWANDLLTRPDFVLNLAYDQELEVQQPAVG